MARRRLLPQAPPTVAVHLDQAALETAMIETAVDRLERKT
jgi:hypothetical protein